MTIPAALHPFLILAKSATGAACADIIKQATSAPGVYTFTPLLESENVQKLAGTEHEKSLLLLKLFSWGTYQDYIANKQSLPPLSNLQIEKLRRLTLVTLASHSHDLPYSTIMQALSITEIRTLEDLCINTIYSSLLTGKLSPQTQTFEVHSVTSRDLTPSQDYKGMVSTLSRWSKQCDLVLAEIQGRIRDVRNTEKLRKKDEEDFEKELEKAKQAEEKARGGTESKSKSGGKGKGTGKESSLLGMRDVRDEMGDDVWESNPVRRKRKSPGGS